MLDSLQRGKGLLLQIVSENGKPSKLRQDKYLAELLSQFSEVFEEPMGLQQFRSHDHRIILKKRTQPISIKLYNL